MDKYTTSNVFLTVQTKIFHFFSVLCRRRSGRIALDLLAIPCFGYLLLMIALLANPLPIEDFQSRPSESWRILDRKGRLLREVANPDGVRVKWVELTEISPLVVEATIAAEDERFYSHSGVDVIAVLRAVCQNITARRMVSGASTVTMQLARMRYGHSHNLQGKLKQAFDALRIERAIDKKTILEQYLNRAPYGAGTVGIEAASQRYFEKPSLHLNLSEAALLAGLPKAPSDLNPLRNLEAARKRQRFVLFRLLKTGKINRDKYRQTRQNPLQIASQPTKLSAMHFTDYVLSQSPPPGDVITTLDRDLQHQIENLVKVHVESLRSGGLTNAAVIVLDNYDGAILAMVGSADYWNSNDGSVNGAIARRQPGSTLKPFTYALAFEAGFTPASIIPDIETQYLGSEGLLFIPSNYSEKFYGPVVMAEALGRSLNIPAIRTLNEVGVSTLLERLREIGFISLDQDTGYYGLGLTLGNGEVTLLELAQGYATFARGGLTCKAKAIVPTPIHDLKEGNSPPLVGNTVDLRENNSPPLVGGVRGGGAEQSDISGHSDTLSPPPNLPHQAGGMLTEAPQRIFSEEICFLITDILSDERIRIRAFGAANPLLLGFPMAVKTGTSANWRDNWVIGYTPRYTVAVWAGDFKGNPMDRMSGAIGAGPLFHKIAKLVVHREALPKVPARAKPPEGVEQIEVCALSGMTPTEHCPHRHWVYVLKENTPRPPCDLHRKLRIDKRNGLLASDRCPSAFVEEKIFEVLPSLYAEWQADHDTQHPPTRYSPYCPEKGIIPNALIITSPREGDVYLIEPGYDRSTQTLQLNGEVDPALPEITWLVDGEKVTAAAWPYEAIWPMNKGTHRLEMVGGGMRSDPIEFEVR